VRVVRRVPLDRRPLTAPHPARLDRGRADYDLVVRLHTSAMERGAATYTDPATGYEVFTAAWLAARGACCDAGCRHCPYLPS
jgi:hypothetical protein